MDQRPQAELFPGLQAAKDWEPPAPPPLRLTWQHRRAVETIAKHGGTALRQDAFAVTIQSLDGPALPIECPDVDRVWVSGLMAESLIRLGLAEATMSIGEIRLTEAGWDVK